MSDTTLDNDDLSTTHEYIIAGGVILLFGLLYWFFNSDQNSNSQGFIVEPQINNIADSKTIRKGYPLTQAVVASSATVSASSSASSPDAKLSVTSETTLPEKSLEGVVEIVNNEPEVSISPKESIIQEQKELNEAIPSNTEVTKAIESEPQKTDTPVVAEVTDNLNLTEQKADPSLKPENEDVVPTYALPDGTLVKISANGFEGELQQLFQNGQLNVPLTYDQVYFETGSTKTTAKSDRQIRVTAALMNAYPKIDILLHGHTDNRGAATDNFQLSLMRANSMGIALGDLGINTERIRVLGMGDGFPVGSNNTEEGRKKNRRIDVLLQ